MPHEDQRNLPAVGALNSQGTGGHLSTRREFRLNAAAAAAPARPPVAGGNRPKTGDLSCRPNSAPVNMSRALLVATSGACDWWAVSGARGSEGWCVSCVPKSVGVNLGWGCTGTPALAPDYTQRGPAGRPFLIKVNGAYRN